MGLDAGTPPGLWERVRSIAADEVAKFMRSGFLRNASISGGGLTIRGGFLRLMFGDVPLLHVGPVLPAAPDGTPQQGLLIRRSNGTLAMAMYDSSPDDATAPNQALTWWDRTNHIVMSDDTFSGQGIARPYVVGGFGRHRFADWDVATTSASFETLFTTHFYKQHPRLEVSLRASMDTAATTGEVRVMVDGVQLGATTAESFAITTRYFVGAVAGNHMTPLLVEIQGRVTSGTGALKVESRYWAGKQS